VNHPQFCCHTLIRLRLAFALILVVVISMLPAHALHEPPLRSAAQEPSSNGIYFAETGHNLNSPFLERWRMIGGERVLGAPISEERYQEDVGVVQSFEGMTLIYDPSIPPPGDLQGQKLPNEMLNDLAPDAARRRVEECGADAFFCQFFPQTGHTVSGRVGAFWSASGDISILGLPLSEPFKDPQSGRTRQLFERSVLEDYGQDDVRLMPIGRELSDEAIQAGDLAFAPAPPTGGSTKLVTSPEGLRLRDKPGLDSNIIVVLPDAAEFIQVAGSAGEWIPGYADGYSGWVSSEFLREPPPLPQIKPEDWKLDVWQGATLGESNVRAAPTTGADIVEVLPAGSSLTVRTWVKGEEVFPGADQWAQIGTNRFIYSRNIGRNAPVLPTPIPPNAPTLGKWIDVQLTQQLMTLYEDRNPVRVIVMTSGMAGWETPEGSYQILSRVPNETMTSGAIGAEHFYKLEDVLFTQYFTNEGHAIHFAWWRTPETIGRPGSHGCLNVLLDDARFLWDWAEIGTPVLIHKT
jgi:hypothetical protein